MATPSSLVSLSLVVCAICSISSAAPAGTLSEILRLQAGAGDADLHRYSQPGEVFATILPPSRPGEVAAAGAVWIPVTVNYFIDQFRDIERFKKSPAVLNIGKIANPLAKGDMAALHLSPKELDELGACRPEKCSFKLSSDLIGRLRTGPKGSIDAEFRSALIAFVTRYQSHGNAVMMEYDDKNPPVNTSREFLHLLDQFEWVGRYAPRLLQVLREPTGSSADASDFYYWSKESFGLKPVVSITHVVIVRTTIDGKPWAFLASKQIYADHYFEASLGLTVLASESTNADKPLTAVAYFNRSQTDGLTGWLSSLKRTIVERRARASMMKSLSEMRERLTKNYRDQLAR